MRNKAEGWRPDWSREDGHCTLQTGVVWPGVFILLPMLMQLLPEMLLKAEATEVVATGIQADVT